MGARLAKVGSHDVIASAQQLADLIRQVEAEDRIALDTEADSLHSYREKLCLLQISVPASANVDDCRDFILDPLADLRFATAAASAGIERNCSPWSGLRFADAPAWLEFRGQQNLRHSHCSAAAWDSRVQSGCAGEAVLRCRASRTFAKKPIGGCGLCRRA